MCPQATHARADFDAAAGSNPSKGGTCRPPSRGDLPKAAPRRGTPAEEQGERAGKAGAQGVIGDPDPRDWSAVVPSQATPLEVMLEVMRFHHAIARHALGADPSCAKTDLETAADHFDRAHRVAKDLAPYFSPKAKEMEPQEPGADAVQNDDRSAPSELEVARRLAFVLELARRGLLEGGDRQDNGNGPRKAGNDVGE